VAYDKAGGVCAHNALFSVLKALVSLTPASVDT